MSTKTKVNIDKDIQRLEETLSQKLGAAVVLRHGAKGAGQIVIKYASLDELDGFLARF